MQQGKEFVTLRQLRAIKELEAAKKANEDSIKHIDTMLSVLYGKGCGGESLHDWYKE